MQITLLHIHTLRNLLSISLRPSGSFNLFFGSNGSGKTSILESIHLLALGRSFRHHLIDAVINHDATRLSVMAKMLDEHAGLHTIGIEKDRTGKTTIRMDEETITSMAPLAVYLPLQLIHPDSDMLISGSPKLRRQLIDWGTFHVEPGFFLQWKRWQKILKQRNAALKQNGLKEQVLLWDEEYASVCELISQYRLTYLNKLKPFFEAILADLLASPRVTFSYKRGWPHSCSLVEALNRHFERDKQLGYTYYGLQRDDMVLQCGKHAANEVLSRGEQKLTVIALRLAQGQLLKETFNKTCLYLLDDFTAELDGNHRRKVLTMLDKLSAQVFMTATDKEEVMHYFQGSTTPYMFHVEQGNVNALQ